MIVQIDKANDAKIYGNKAKGLYDLTQLGLPVPEGFAIPFSTRKNEIAAYVKRNCSAKKIYAVRSSSNAEDSENHSFAGLFDTFIGVGRKDLLKMVDSVKKMKGNKRILEFCKKMKKKVSEIQIAIIVQELISSEKSGVCFTKNPSNNSNEIYIEAIRGLGEYIVSGEVNPDVYKVSKKSLSIKSKEIVAQHKMLSIVKNKSENVPVFFYNQKMTDNEIIQLSKYSLKIERYYKKPIDIEFAISKGKIYLLQTRPITT